MPRPPSAAALLACSLALVPCAPSRDAAAQSPRIEASVRAGQARAAARRGEVPEAIRLYRASIELRPLPDVVREFAELLERQGQLREAASQWSRYVGLAPDEAARDAAARRLEALRRTASRVRVRVSPPLAARYARVWFDHDPPRPVPAGGAESVVEGGSHRVRVESPGWAVFETMVTTAFGEPVELVARLRPAPDAGAAAP